MGIWAREKGLAYEAFEPEPLEARCCDLNNFGGEAQTHRVALWNEGTTLTFHSKPDTADSSVFEIDDATGARDVQAVRLDAVIDPATFGPGTRIFKLEGEGAEPEILQGAEGLLPHLDYIAADCGYERGRAAQHTFIEVNDFLLARGYRLIEAGFTRVTVVYRNEARFSQS
ncbi:MAG: FkbM family methyltransferase [Roseicyclus sp.]|uniref:FkbM family methyltransferase n=1 Tax=Roseicyclus sp. TaxID=1914329 RepID=UPI003A88CBCC